MPEVYPKQFFQKGTLRTQKASCFLMMPFAPEFDPVHELVHDTLQSPDLNIVCRRADDIRAPNILETILASIVRSEYIIADLTNCNPNVFYELGVAHCKKDAWKVILLAQSMEFVPFDLRHLRCIIYQNTESGRAALRSELIATFQAVCSDSFRFKVSEGARFHFGKKLVGHNKNLFEFDIHVHHIGYGVVKLTINFTEHAIDQETSTVEPQFVMLSQDDSAQVRVQNIPWTLHLAHYEDRGALLVLERS